MTAVRIEAKAEVKKEEIRKKESGVYQEIENGVIVKIEKEVGAKSKNVVEVKTGRAAPVKKRNAKSEAGVKIGVQGVDIGAGKGILGVGVERD